MSRSEGGSRGPRRRQPFAAALVCAAVALCVGCQPTLDTSPASDGRLSVNGIDVLFDLSRDFGFKTSTQRRVNEALLDRGDVLFWCPKEDAPPTAEEIEWIESWLQHQGGRVVVYVGPWFDAAPGYWRKVAATAPADEKVALLTEAEESEAAWSLRQSEFPFGEPCEWFTISLATAPANGAKSSTIGAPVTGASEWTRGLDPKKLELDVPVETVVTYESEELLSVGGRRLVSAVDYFTNDEADSRLLVVVNGTFLYNLPLANSEHRLLAGRLLSSVERFARQADGGASRDPLEAIFLLGEADPHGGDPSASKWAVLGVPPLSWVLLQLTALGLLYCFSRWPIVGRPRELVAADASDFGRHVEALGDLLEQTGDEAFADRRARQWREVKK